MMIRATLGVLGLVVLAAAPVSATGEQLPNLVPRAPFNVVIAAADPGSGAESALRLSTTTQNLGGGHLELIGLPPTSADETAAQQCAAWDGRVCTQYERVGSFAWHAEHQHWHLQDYARYDVRALTVAGEPDMSPEGLLRTGGKISFCLLDSEATESAPGFPQDPFAETGFYNGCTGLIQGISTGWADTYGSYLQGQQVLIDGLPDGPYALVITVNPEHLLRESSYDDNTSFAVIALKDGDVRVEV